MIMHTLDELIAICSPVRGGKVWLMSAEYYDHIRWHGPKDHDGKFAYTGPELSGYGTLLGIKIVIVDFDYFGIARI